MTLRPDTAEVAEEFSRARRNRTFLASLVLILGLVVVVLPDIQGGTLGIGSVIFIAVLALAYYRIFDSRKRAEEGVDSFPAIANAIQIIRLSSDSLAKVVGYYVVPDGWLIKRSLLTFDFVPVSSICWVYGKETKHSVNFIPTHTEHSLVVKLRSGKTLRESYRRKMRDEKLGILRRVAPWALFGYSEQLENAWRKDRESFAVEVDRRRRVLVWPQEGA